MRIHLISFALVVLTAAGAGAQPAPRGVRIAGTIKSIAAADLILATAKGNVEIGITPQTRVLVRQPAATDDIKQGAYLGTSNQNSTEPGTGTAKEVHLMDKGPNVNFAMNKSGLMMTNGHVKSVTHTAKGDEMDIDYGQAETRHVIVNKDTVMTRMVDLGAAGLKPGLEVSAVTTTGTGGKPTATFIVVTKPSP
ncbi:MAG TPA: hypothetical protein VKB67_09385 [Rhizomicrobium sp.]|nr:hypothetical protein [Rhizomicrobium sp.]